MAFEKYLLELQEMKAKFLDIHANPYDTSKHNDTAEKLAKIQEALAKAKTDVLERLKAFPKATIQITATFNHSGNPDYTVNPTAYMDGGYSTSQRTANGIPTTITQRRDYLKVKAENVANLITSVKGIKASQVQANITPGDIGAHIGNGTPFGDRVIITWINDGE